MVLLFTIIFDLIWFLPGKAIFFVLLYNISTF
jgi:hypothetical protein